MTFVAATVKRTGVTNVLTTIDATITGDGSTPIDANDIVGGLSTKTVTFPANDTADKQALWEVVGDSAVEPDEGFKVTLSNPSSPGGTISTPVARGSIMNDDVAGGPTIVFGPTAIMDTGIVQTNSKQHRVSTVHSKDVDRLVTLRVNMIDNLNYEEMRVDGDQAVNFRNYVNGQQVGNPINFSGINVKPVEGTPISLEMVLAPGKTDEWLIKGTIGDQTYVYGGARLGAGTKAQGVTHYSANGTSKAWTIASL